jgi:aquaporin Z
MQAEMVFTCLLCYVVLSVATVTDMSHSKDIFALAIGFSVVAGGYSVGGISGACFNPAASIAIDATYGFIKGGFWRCVPYTFIQCLGGVLAALIFRITHCEEFDEEKLASAYRQEELAQV